MTSGLLVWRKHFMEWKHSTFKSKKDLTLHPHFEITAVNGDTKESVTFDDIQIKDAKLKGINDLTKLPPEILNTILDNVADTLENREGKK